MSTEVTKEALSILLDVFKRKSYDAVSCEEGSLEILRTCELLFKKDYTLVELNNYRGALSSSYPSRILIPEFEKPATASSTTANNTSNSTTPQKISQQSTTRPSGSSSSTISTSNNDIHNTVTYVKSESQQQQNLQLQYPNPQSYPNYLNQQNVMPQQSSAKVTATKSMTNKTKNETIYEALYDFSKVREYLDMARYARCRQRFVVPVILYRGRYVCRSATVSESVESYGRQVLGYANGIINGESGETRDAADTEKPSFSSEVAINNDVLLLKLLNCTGIVDLMVEDRKKKYLFSVSSSEKADPRYQDFNLISLPYPGCEFFKELRAENYEAVGLKYNWSLSFNNAALSIPDDFSFKKELNINWDEYKNWDLVVLTQNYLKACLKYIQEVDAGLLIHCISGWDRTPLFISLVRLSLWADNLIHKTLNPLEMTYLTLAYDWYLFGHQLQDRLKKEEDIMFFCFHVLKYITEDDFSNVEHRRRTKTTSSSGSSVSIPDEPLKEDLISGCEQDSNDSISNTSNCDMSITDNYFANSTTTPTAQGSHSSTVGSNPLTNQSPKRSRTSPISVPVASAARQIQEPTSIGSWVMVSGTGSVESTLNSSKMSCQSGSSTSGARTKKPLLTRRERLESVRTIFIKAYAQTVGLNPNENSSMSSMLLGTLIGQLF